jgi:hypothetical protein
MLEAASMSKYDPLRDYLSAFRLKEIVLTFREIEKILASKLPASADRPQWWANQQAPGRSQREAWRAAGYDAFLIRGSNKVKFVRA